jgi:hypothetical protein
MISLYLSQSVHVTYKYKYTLRIMRQIYKYIKKKPQICFAKYCCISLSEQVLFNIKLELQWFCLRICVYQKNYLFDVRLQNILTLQLPV